MGYFVYLDKLLLPITPSKITLKITNQNKTVNLINDGEVNILKNAGLTDVSFEFMIPQHEYPFAVYKEGFKNAQYYLDKLESMKLSKLPFQYIVSRTAPDGRLLFDTNLKVSLEDYSITEDAGDGFDIMISVNLKQYRPYGTKSVNVTISQDKPKPAVKPAPAPRPPSNNSPAPAAGFTVTVSRWGNPPNDCLWNMAQKYYGNGALYMKIANANPSIKNPSLVYTGQKVFIPA